MRRRRKRGQAETDWKEVLKRGGLLEAHEEEAVIKGLGEDASWQHRCIVRVLILLNLIIFTLFGYMFVLGQQVPLMALTSIGATRGVDSRELDPERPSPEANHAYLAVLTSSSLAVVYLLLLRNGMLRVRRSVRFGAKGAILLAIVLPQVSAVVAYMHGEGFPLLPLVGSFTAGAAMFAMQSQSDMQRMIGELDGMRAYRQGA